MVAGPALSGLCSAPPCSPGRARHRPGRHRRGRGDRRAAGGRAVHREPGRDRGPGGRRGQGGGRHDATTAKAPGWRVVATIGPYNEAVTGTVSAGSATGAWSVWTGTAFTAVERLQGTRWSRVPLPATLTAYARSAVAFGGDSATDFWLFNSRSATHVLRFAGTRWLLQRIPSWVLPRQWGGGGPSVSAAVFGPDNVWVFGLRADPYAAHYDGRGWAKVRLQAVPDEVSAVSADDIFGPCTETWPGTGTARTGPRARSRRQPGARPRATTTSASPGRAAPGCGVTVLVPGPPGRSRPAALERHLVAAGGRGHPRRPHRFRRARRVRRPVGDRRGRQPRRLQPLLPPGRRPLAGGEPAERHLGPAARVPDLDPGHALGLGHRHRPAPARATTA